MTCLTGCDRLVFSPLPVRLPSLPRLTLVVWILVLTSASSAAIPKQEELPPPGPANNQAGIGQPANGSTEKDLDPEAIIDRFIQSAGGYEVHESRYNTHAIYETTSNGQSWTWEIYQEDGRHFEAYRYDTHSLIWRSESFFGRNKDEMPEGFIWTESANGQVRELTGAFGQAFLLERAFVSPMPNWTKLYQKAEYVGSAEINGKELDQIRMTNYHGHLKNLYFDRETGLLLRSTRPSRIPGEADTIIEYFDYRHFGRCKDHLVSTRQIVRESKREFHYQLTEYHFNVKPPPELFVIPPQFLQRHQKLVEKYQMPGRSVGSSTAPKIVADGDPSVSK